MTALYRAGFFARNGFAPYDAQWYSGYHTLGYSVLLGPLGALLGVRLLACLGAVLAAACFARLCDRPVPAAWFAIGVGVSLGASRVAFTLGLGLGLAALLAAVRRRQATACALAVLTGLASPLAGAFLGLVAFAGWPDGPNRAHRLGLLAAAVLPVGILVLAFPAGGFEPFAPSSFWPALGVTALVAVIAPRLRLGLALYGACIVAAFVIHTPVGGNAVRLVVLFAGPLAAAELWPQRRLALGLLVVPLAYLQLQAPVRDLVVGIADPSTSAAYYAPLERFLAAAPGPPFRVEVPFTREHWEAAELAPHFAIARGWERQLDVADNAIFYAPHLASAAYAAWLRTNAIAYVALPDTQLDYSARQEAALIEAGQDYLLPVARLAHWRIFAVRGTQPLASPPASLTRLEATGFQLRFAGPATSEVRLHYTAYWVSGGACVTRAPDGFTAVRALRGGLVSVSARLDLGAALSGGPACPAR
ncbi:MAG: hypothetical protein QOH12_3601 [Solirubrobacteraceae bacterium]|nr:hypothetical protein [Solirubrobacteraceae bacterium]